MKTLLTAQNYSDFPVEIGDARYEYGDDPSQFADLFLPQEVGGRLPVVVLIHGGCWRAMYGLEPIGCIARALTQHGIAVWSLEYRRVGNGGGWPNTFHDVALATDSLRVVADEFSLDLNRVIAVGHSAGGHLVTWLACRGQLREGQALFRPNPLLMKGIVSLAGIPDMVRGKAENICDGALIPMMGGTIDEVPENYREGSPVEMLPFGMPHVHINGDQDWIVSDAYNQAFVAQAQAAGDDAQLVVLEGAGHFEIVTPTHAMFEPVLDNIKAMLAGIGN